MARDFDGVDDNINIGDVASLTDLRACSYVVWIKQDAAPENNVGYIYSKQGAGNAGPRFFTSEVSGNEGRLNFGSDSASSDANPVRITNDNFIGLSVWYGVVMTWDGGVTASNIHLYKISGATMVEATYATTTNGSGAITTDAGASAIIGNRAGTDRTVNGKIAFFQAFNRVITTQEMIQALRFPGSVRNGLVDFHPLWGGSPEPDYSGNGNSGTVTGATVSSDNPPINGVFQVPLPEMSYVF